MRWGLSARRIGAVLAFYAATLLLFQWVFDDETAGSVTRHGRQRARARDVELTQRAAIETTTTAATETAAAAATETPAVAESTATIPTHARRSTRAPKLAPAPVKVCDATIGIAASVHDARHPERSFAMLTTQTAPQAALYRHGDWIGAHRVLAIHPRAVMLEAAGETCWLRMTPRKHTASAKQTKQTKKAAARPKHAKR